MCLEIAPDLIRRLKRLRLGGLLPTLPDRATHARQAKLSPLEFLASPAISTKSWSIGTGARRR